MKIFIKLPIRLSNHLKSAFILETMEQPRSNSRYLDHHHFESDCSLSLRYRLMNETSTVQQKNIFPNQVEKDGTIIYPFMDEDGHQYFDVCSCTVCVEENYESDEDIRIRRRKKKDPLYRRYLEGDTSVGLLGDGKYNLIVQYSDKKEEPRHQIVLINLDYFPPRKDFIKDDIVHTPKILSNAVNSFAPTS